MAINKVVYGGNTLIDLTGDSVTAAGVLDGVTAHDKSGRQITGVVPDNGAVEGVIDTADGEYTIPYGYHDGKGKVSIDATERAKLVPDNIRKGVTILGIEGTMSGIEGVNSQVKTVTPSVGTQTILPDDGYNYLSGVTVNAIPYAESENSAGGITVTIAG